MSAARVPSLRHQLLRGLLLAVLPLWLLTTGLQAWHAGHEIDELYDGQQQLFARQLYAALPLWQAGAGRVPRSHDSHQALAAWNARGQRLFGSGAPLPPPQAQGFRELALAGANWRVFYLSGPDGSVAVAQEQHERREALQGLLLGQLLQGLLLLPLMLIALYWGVRRGLQPLASLRHALAQRAADEAAPLSQAVPAELRPLIDAINELLARVAATLQRERHFTADAAHELRSPLAALRVQAELLTLLTDTAARDAAAAKVIQGADRASHLVEQLLQLSRLDATRELPGRALCWPLLLDELGQQCALQAAERQVALTLSCEGDGPLAHGDPTLLLLMLRNLLDNAIRYSPPGASVAVEVTAQAVVVRDDGPGLTPLLRQRVGERFFRPAGQEQDGSGLGLSIVRRVAELHGLQLALDAEQPHGLRVTLR